MTNDSETTVGTAQNFSTVQKCITIFGVVGVIVLATMVVIAMAHGSVSTFMWVRAGILLAITPVLYRLAARASRGMRKDLERLRSVALVLPIAIVVIDLIPGICPTWYAAMQAVSAVPLIAIAIILRRRVPSV